jgi:hypothetical protein
MLPLSACIPQHARRCPQITRVVPGANGDNWTCPFPHTPDVRDDASLVYWVFDPLYYNYANCSCLTVGAKHTKWTLSSCNFRPVQLCP